ASLWGANIAALFPIIEVTLNGDSLQQWNTRRLEGANTRIESSHAEIKRLTQQLESPESTDDLKIQARTSIDALTLSMRGDEVVVYASHNLTPWLDRFIPTDPFQTILLVTGFVVVSTFLKHIFMLASALIVSWVAMNISRNIRLSVFNKALELDRSQFMQRGASGFMAQVTGTSDMLAGGLTSVFGGAVTEPLKIFACLAGAWCISWQLTLACLTMAPVVGFLMVWLNRRIRGVSQRILDRAMGFHHVLFESLGNILTVQAYTMEKFEKERFRTCTKNMMRTGMWHTFYYTLANPITEILGIGMVATSIVVGAWLVINHETQIFGITMTDRPMTVPGIMVFFGMLIGASDPVRKLSGVFTGINTGIVGAQALYPLLDTPSRLTESPNPKSLPSPHREIRLRNVSFSYDGIDTVLRDVDLVINFGERVAIVGPNGGGKSTLVNLICRFYDPTKGAVLLDGVLLTDLSLYDLRRRIAIVTQQTELFNETILHNIRYGRWDATVLEIEAAAQKAHAHEFITEFPDGYNTMVGPNGYRLSGGQRQRIALARAFLRDAEILVLDEATSQIDVESERLIHDALAMYVANRTVIMITHRASTLALADTIVNIDHGIVTKKAVNERSAA
ncbi:MAG: ABC transporter ATP-binding protein/permease, partial [Pirellulales bacterium]|nr:ABC transporter ATP-binding protein/permease [Pirellulales bacterium]